MKPIHRRLTYILYILLYIALPTAFVIYSFYQDFNLPQWADYFGSAAGFGLMFFIAAAAVISNSTFPSTWKPVLALFAPYVINALFILLNSDTSIVSSLMMHSVITYVGLIFGYILMAFIVPWERDNNDKFINGLKVKLKYIKTNPTIWIAFVVLLLPISFGVYLFMSGFVMAGDMYDSILGVPASALYIAMALNVTFFHLGTAKLSNEKIFGGGDN